MRISMDSKDSGYYPSNLKRITQARVYLNGEELKYCITADDQKGVAVVYDMEAMTRGMKEIPRKNVYGTVIFEFIGIGEDEK